MNDYSILSLLKCSTFERTRETAICTVHLPFLLMHVTVDAMREISREPAFRDRGDFRTFAFSHFSSSFTLYNTNHLLVRHVFDVAVSSKPCVTHRYTIVMETKGHDHGRSALVLYGTETGTSQDLAEEVGRALERLLFDVDVTGCDNATHENLKLYDLTVFLLSTTGQGDFPSNATKLWTSLLRKKLPQTLLAGVGYAMVGLCDSSYPKFNWAARKMEKRLQQLGAEEIIESCEADEQGEDSTDGAFLAWLDQFKSAVLTRFPLPREKAAIPEFQVLPSKWVLRQASNVGPSVNGHIQGGSKLPPILPDSFPVYLDTNDRVTPTSHWQDVRLLRLRTPEDIHYLPGDALAISPENLSPDVNTLIDLMDWHEIADLPLVLYSNSSTSRKSSLNSPPLPLTPDHHKISLRELLTHYLDITAIPRRSFFAAIAKYTASPTQKERLLEFTEPQYLDEYYDYATRPRRSILEILQEFGSVKIPWEEVINVFPVLRARQFSIASGGALKHPDGGTTFELLVAIVKYKTVIKRVREGVCTRHLAQLPVGSTINVSLRTEGRFVQEMPQLQMNDHLLIGAGTGVAPLRSLVHEKAHACSANAGTGTSTDTGMSTMLVFGARNENADFFFADEWADFSSQQHMPFEVLTAFSRDQKQKVYVQDRLRQRVKQIRALLMDAKTMVIVCGASGAMPKAVRQALVDVLSGSEGSHDGRSERDEVGHERGMSREDAEGVLVRMEREGRYKQETWS